LPEEVRPIVSVQMHSEVLVSQKVAGEVAGFESDHRPIADWMNEKCRIGAVQVTCDRGDLAQEVSVARQHAHVTHGLETSDERR
jgi:hypothetical protein